MLNTAEQLNYKQLYSCKFNAKQIQKISNVLQFMFNKADVSGFIKIRQDNIVRNLKICDIANTYKIRQILDNFKSKEDIFISKNVFKTIDSMEESNIQALQTIIIDVDYKNIKDFKMLTCEQVLNLLEQKSFNVDVPIPNLVEYSNQIRLIYVLEQRIGATIKSKGLVKKIEKTLSNKLAWIGADSKNSITNGVRLVESYNTNVKKTERIYATNDYYKDFSYTVRTTVKYFNAKHSQRSANFIYSNYKYSLQELTEEWLDLNYEEYIKIKEEKNVKREEIKKQNDEEKKSNRKAKKTNRHNNISYIFASNLTPEKQKDYSLQMCRIQDLEKIQKYFNYNMDGKQEYLTFLYRNFCIKANMSIEEAEKNAIDFYNKFVQHDNSINRTESKTRNVEKKQYKYKNETILRDLEISTEDEINMQLKTIISAEEKKRRQKIANVKQKLKLKEERHLIKEKKNMEFISKIKELKKQGFTQEQISKELNKSIATIKRWWNK